MPINLLPSHAGLVFEGDEDLFPGKDREYKLLETWEQIMKREYVQGFQLQDYCSLSDTANPWTNMKKIKED